MQSRLNSQYKGTTMHMHSPHHALHPIVLTSLKIKWRRLQRQLTTMHLAVACVAWQQLSAVHTETTGASTSQQHALAAALQCSQYQQASNIAAHCTGQTRMPACKYKPAMKSPYASAKVAVHEMSAMILVKAVSTRCMRRCQCMQHTTAQHEEAVYTVLYVRVSNGFRSNQLLQVGSNSKLQIWGSSISANSRSTIRCCSTRQQYCSEVM